MFHLIGLFNKNPGSFTMVGAYLFNEENNSVSLYSAQMVFDMAQSNLIRNCAYSNGDLTFKDMILAKIPVYDRFGTLIDKSTTEDVLIIIAKPTNAGFIAINQHFELLGLSQKAAALCLERNPDSIRNAYLRSGTVCLNNKDSVLHSNCQIGKCTVIL